MNGFPWQYQALSSQTKGLIFFPPFSLGDWPGEMRRKGHVLTRGTTNVSHLPISIQPVYVCAHTHDGRSTTFICLTRLQRPRTSSCHCVPATPVLYRHTWMKLRHLKVCDVPGNVDDTESSLTSQQQVVSHPHAHEQKHHVHKGSMGKIHYTEERGGLKMMHNLFPSSVQLLTKIKIRQIFLHRSPNGSIFLNRRCTKPYILFSYENNYYPSTQGLLNTHR